MNAFAQFAPTVILLVLAWRVRKTLKLFQAAGALAPESAQPLAALGVRRSPALRILKRHGVLVDVGDGRYYLDTAAHERWRRRRRKILAVVLGAVALLAFVLAMVNR